MTTNDKKNPIIHTPKTYESSIKELLLNQKGN